VREGKSRLDFELQSSLLFTHEAILRPDRDVFGGGLQPAE
jgi:hypothetical protein